jgi:ABC-type antimicrobial peptide transport system permease subunit
MDAVPDEPRSDAIRRALQAVDPLLPIGELRRADALKASAFRAYRFEAAALATFAALALLLAAVGLYGIVAHGLTERRREFGIRAAIGATRWQAVRAAAAPGLQLATTGILIGCLLGWLFGRTLRHLVVGVTTADVLTFAIVAGTLFVVAAAVSVLPALAATRLNVADTLRAE